MTSSSRAFDGGAWSNSQSARRRLLRGGAWSAVGFGLSLLLGLPLTIALVRLLPHRTYGSLAVALSICALVGTVATLGLADGIVRTVSADTRFDAGADEEADFARTAVWLALIGGMGAAAVGLGIAAGLHGTRLGTSSKLILIGLPIAVLAPFQSAATGLVRASYRPRVSFAATLTASLVSLLGISALLAAGVRSGFPIMGIRAASAVGASVVLVAPFRHLVRMRGRVSATIARPILAVGGTVVLTTLAATAISQLDVVAVGIFRGSASAGVYAPLSRLIDVVSMAFGMLGTYALAALSGATTAGTTAVAEQYHWCTRAVLVVLGPVVAVLVVAPGPVIHLLFGLSASHAAAVLRIMAIAACGHLLLGYNGLCLIALGRSRLVLVQGVVALGLSIIACFTLVPAFGLYGAAESTAIALLGSNLVASTYLRRRYDISPFDRAALLTVLGFLVSTVFAIGLSAVLGRGVGGAVMTFVVVAAGTFVTTRLTDGGSVFNLRMVRARLSGNVQ